MYDRTMPDVSLLMEADLSAPVPALLPPAPYRIRPYREGDEAAWCAIETTAGEFPHTEDAMKRGFMPYFHTDALLLPERMFFVVDENDIPVATTTAWFEGEIACLHWVAVHEDHQRKGLARSAIAAAMRQMQKMGYSRVTLHTQPPSWVAIKLYLEFGFQPTPSADEKVRTGWNAVYAKLGKDPLYT